MSRRLHRDDATVQSLFLFFARWKSPPDAARQGDLGRWVRGVAVGPDRARSSVKDNGVEGGRRGDESPDVASQGDLGRWVRGVTVEPDRARPSVKDNGVEGGRCGGAYLQDLLSSVQPFSHEVIELTSRM